MEKFEKATAEKIELTDEDVNQVVGGNGAMKTIVSSDEDENVIYIVK